MKSCLILINKNAGKCKKCSFEKIKAIIGNDRHYVCIYLPCDSDIDFKTFDEIAICGGDGTLSTIMQKIYNFNIDVYYFPCGTLNDKSKAEYTKTTYTSKPNTKNTDNFVSKKSNTSQNDIYTIDDKKSTHTMDNSKYSANNKSPKNHTMAENKNTLKNAVIGKVDDKVFTYVFASGTFTPIGYDVNIKLKKRFGILAYIFDILKNYKIYSQRVTIQCDENIYDGTFTLIMFIKSPRCFGLTFNYDYDKDFVGGNLVAIRTPKHSGLIGKIEIFFPFFKVFFVGLKQPLDNGKIIFQRFSNGNIKLDAQTDFCVDGEKHSLSGTNTIAFEKTKCRLKIINDI